LPTRNLSYRGSAPLQPSTSRSAERAVQTVNYFWRAGRATSATEILAAS
jgi:hypothetical protein